MTEAERDAAIQAIIDRVGRMSQAELLDFIRSRVAAMSDAEYFKFFAPLCTTVTEDDGDTD